MLRTSRFAFLLVCIMAAGITLATQAGPAGAQAHATRLPQPSPAAGTARPGGDAGLPAADERPLGSTGLAFSNVPLVANPAKSTIQDNSSTAVDGSGGVHVVFSDATNIYYRYCAGGCSNAGNWSQVVVAPAGDLAYDTNMPTVAVDTSGHPRLMWWAQHGNVQGYYYAERNSGVWTQVALPWPPGTDAGPYAPQTPGYFTLDANGHPRMVYPASIWDSTAQTRYYGFYYGWCASGCTTAGNWRFTFVTMSDVQPELAHLAISATGRHSVLGYGSGFPTGTAVVIYAQCDTGCTTATNWRSAKLFNPASYSTQYPLAMRLDSHGNPRIAFLDDSSDKNVIYYAWSNANSLSASGWMSYTLNYPGRPTFWTLDLGLDGQDMPHIAFTDYPKDTMHERNSDSYLNYLSCTANCENTSGAVWQPTTIETSGGLQTLYPMNTEDTCTYSWWDASTTYPSLAFDSAGNPYVSYATEHDDMCGEVGQTVYIDDDAHAILVAVGGGGAPAGPTATPRADLTPVAYLPLARK